MILLLGSSGYIGSAFYKEIAERNLLCSLWTTKDWERVTFDALCSVVNAHKPTLVISCAAFVPIQGVSLCDQHPEETIQANVVLPNMLAKVCDGMGVTFAQISTGCLWSDGQDHSEDDIPQRGFSGHCGTYIGTKIMGERMVRHNCSSHYIWRVRLPFDEIDHPRNYLSKLARFDEVYDHDNTLCHRGDFVKACLDLWQMRADWGTYHVANPGSVKATDIVSCLYAKGIRTTIPKIVEGPQGGSRLSVKKMEKAGVRLRPIEEAVAEAINNWKTNVSPAHELPSLR